MVAQQFCGKKDIKCSVTPVELCCFHRCGVIMVIKIYKICISIYKPTDSGDNTNLEAYQVTQNHFSQAIHTI